MLDKYFYIICKCNMQVVLDSTGQNMIHIRNLISFMTCHV